jgi:dipeptidyl-peptidase 4
MTRCIFAGLLVLCISTLAITQEHPPADASQLTNDRLFSSTEFQEDRLGLWTWSHRSPSYYTFVDADAPKGTRDLVRIDCRTKKQTTIAESKQFVPPGSDKPIAIDAFEFSNDESKLLIYTNSQRVWRRNTRGDYWIFDFASRKLQKLGGEAPAASLMFAKFSPDCQSVAYVRDNNLYVQQLDTMSIVQLTNDGSPTLINGTADWVNEEELDIRDGYRWSPDSQSLAFWQFDTTGVPEFTLLDNTSDKYPRPIHFAYPKVGMRNSAVRIGVIDIASKSKQWIEVTGDAREHYIARLEWIPEGQHLILQQFNRLQNVNRVLLADSKTGATREILVETETTWLENENPVRWLIPGKEFLWISERDGWRHAYRVDIATGSLECLTPGDFDVISIEAIDHKHGWLYYAASPENATQRYLYRVHVNDAKTERVTSSHEPGWHTYDFAPDAQFVIHTYSTFTTPPTSELVSLPDNQTVRELLNNNRLREKLKKLDLPTVEFLQVESEQGVQLDAWCLKPPNLNPSATYPLLLHVYGEPHGQTVRDAWMGTKGLWHWLLAQQGYVVASIDNRGTMSPRGRNWRKCVHRQIGILASKDQAGAAEKLLARWPYADRNRVGIWGWSGGGSMSLNAIFRYPEFYKVAIAVAPVPDQLLYDTIYQERYMGLPSDNAEGYRQGSPITFAKQLKGDLLVIHGTGDDNCHYQGVELLMNELIAHNKQFSVMPYPGRSHSIAEGKNTARHFYGLMTDYLQKHLLRLPANVQQAAESVPLQESTSEWQSQMIEGWNVHVRTSLMNEHPDQVKRAIELIAIQLREILHAVPASAVCRLQEVPLWISPEYPGIGPRAEYHPGERWLRDHGRDPVMVKGIEFTNVRIFDAEMRRMPNFVLHELAHAYHDRVLGNDHEAIKDAFERAKASGRYDRVQRQDSEGRRTIERAYGMTSPQEYFAESTEAYFGRNDFEPFDNAELKALDPVMHLLLTEIWTGK